MTPQTYDWLNRIGIILCFISFWLITPELIGETTLKRWEQLFIKRATILRKIVEFIWIAYFILLFGPYFFRAFKNRHLDDIPFSQIFMYAFIAALALWLTYLEKNSVSIISKIANNSTFRRHLLIIGGFLFTISIVLQLWATFKPSAPI